MTPVAELRSRIQRLEALIDAATEELVSLKTVEIRIARNAERVAAGLPRYEITDADPVSDAPSAVVRAWALAEGVIAPGQNVSKRTRQLYYAAGEPGRRDEESDA